MAQIEAEYGLSRSGQPITTPAAPTSASGQPVTSQSSSLPISDPLFIQDGPPPEPIRRTEPTPLEPRPANVDERRYAQGRPHHQRLAGLINEILAAQDRDPTNGIKDWVEVQMQTARWCKLPLMWRDVIGKTYRMLWATFHQDQVPEDLRSTAKAVLDKLNEHHQYLLWSRRTQMNEILHKRINATYLVKTFSRVMKFLSRLKIFLRAPPVEIAASCQ